MVRADSARIAGGIEGSVAIRQLVVESGARIAGDVDYESISIENGAQIDGRLRHTANLKNAPVNIVTPALGAPKEFKMFDAADRERGSCLRHRSDHYIRHRRVVRIRRVHHIDEEADPHREQQAARHDVDHRA